MNSNIFFIKTSKYNCLGAVKFISLSTREKAIQWLINDINIKNGEIRIKVQDGRFVLVEVESRLRADPEGIEVLERMKF